MLDNFLKKKTKSELWHQRHPNELSSTYERIHQIKVGDQTVYLFQFNRIIRNGKFAIQKESRFTEVPLHSHTTIEMNYVYEGVARYVINGKEIILKKGDVCILDTNVVHKLEYVDEESIIMNIEMRPEYFSTSFLTQLMDEGVVAHFLLNAINQQKNDESFLLFKTGEQPEFREVITMLFCEYFDKQMCAETILAAYMLIIFSLLVRLYKKVPQDDKVTLSEDIIAILEYMEDHYQTLTLTALAKQFSYHPNYISAVLKHSLGKSFRELKLDIQIQQAKILVQNTKIPIYEIATEVGFSNLGQFYRQFVKYNGVKPNVLRNSIDDNL